MAFEHYDKCSLLLPMDGVNNGTTFTDWSPIPKTVTVIGDTKTVTSESKYYGSSGYFDGTGDYLGISGTTATNDVIGTGDFTFAAWVYMTGLDTIWLGTTGQVRGTLGGGFAFATRHVTFSNVLRFFDYTTDSGVNASTATPLNEWVHCAVTRQSGTLRMFINGVKDYEGSVTSDFSNYMYFRVGATPGTTPGGSPGAATDSVYINDFILTVGAALWTDTFTPPTRLIGELTGTVTDASGNPAERSILVLPRTYPTKVYNTTSDVAGDYSLRVPATECVRIALADEATLYNDIADRIIPE